MILQAPIGEARHDAGQAGSRARMLHLTDVSDMEAALAPPCECIQLSPGEFSGEFSSVDLNGVRIRSHVCNRGVQIRQHVDDSKVVVAFTTRGGSVHEHGREWLADHFLIVNGADADVSCIARSDITSIEVDLNALDDDERDRFLKTAKNRAVLVTADSEASEDLRSYVLGLLRIAGSNRSLLYNGELCERMELEIRRRLQLMLASSRVSAESRRQKKDLALVERVERFMFENLEEPLTLKRICANTNYRMRRVMYSFKDWFGLGPITYLKIRRLNAVHRRLKEAQGDSRIFDVAADFGFWHMGHFSADYKRMFGVPPSVTVANARLRSKVFTH